MTARPLLYSHGYAAVGGKRGHTLSKPNAASLLDYYLTLRRRNGSRNWWPAAHTFEIVAGAILVQGTAWTNVELALEELRRRDWLDQYRMWKVAESDLAEAIRPAGTYRQKAKRLRSFLALFHGSYGGSWGQMAGEPPETLRDKLLATWGIGPETADCILLYGLGMPTFVADAYTRRVFERHGLIPVGAGYEAVRRTALDALPLNVLVFNDFHAQLVWLGQEWCRPKPRCQGCPLQTFLPPEGLVENPCNPLRRTNHARKI